MRKRWIWAAGLAGLLVIVLAAGAAVLWVAARGQPDERNEELFPGVTYLRMVRQSPRAMVIHLVKVDLRTPGLSFLVTPGDPEAELSLEARTTSEFLKEFNAQVAINGDGFTPWYTRGLLDYYPHSGDPVEPVGMAASRGVVYAEFTDAEPVLYISRQNQARFRSPPGKVYNAISGNLMLVEQGEGVVGQSGTAAENDQPQPRSAVGLDRRSRTLFLVVVDGRQPGYSEGATLAELAEILVQAGAYTAMNLDGGGSSTLVMEGGNGNARLLNSPIHGRLPGVERPVGNHLGIFIER